MFHSKIHSPIARYRYGSLDEGNVVEYSSLQMQIRTHEKTSLTVETSIIQSLRDGHEAAFIWLVEKYHSSLVRLACYYVRDETVAEELAQETWISVLQGLSRFEGRSSLKTWIFAILTNKAKTRGKRESRIISYTDLEELRQNEPAVDPERFKIPSANWLSNHWEGIPEDMLHSKETMNFIRKTIDALPESQRLVITLHDIEELSTNEVCNILEISETNQRVLLHRARARVRQALEDYL